MTRAAADASLAETEGSLKPTRPIFAGVELTDPDAVLLADETERVPLAWIEAIKAGKRPQKAGKHPQGPSKRASEALSGDDISIYEVLAEGGDSNSRYANKTHNGFRDLELESFFGLLEPEPYSSRQ